MADEGDGEGGKGEVNVGAAVVADDEASEAGHPGECSLDDSSEAAKVLAGLDPPPADARGDAALSEGTFHGTPFIAFVGVELHLTLAPMRADLRDSVEGRLYHLAVVPIGRAQGDTERRALGIGDEVAFGARLAGIRRVRAGLRAALLPE